MTLQRHVSAVKNHLEVEHKRMCKLQCQKNERDVSYIQLLNYQYDISKI